MSEGRHKQRKSRNSGAPKGTVTSIMETPARILDDGELRLATRRIRSRRLSSAFGRPGGVPRSARLRGRGQSHRRVKTHPRGWNSARACPTRPSPGRWGFRSRLSDTACRLYAPAINVSVRAPDKGRAPRALDYKNALNALRPSPPLYFAARARARAESLRPHRVLLFRWSPGETRTPHRHRTDS